jgi:hypothetical protein
MEKGQDHSWPIVIPGCAFLGAGPESILTMVVMVSGLARSLSSGRALRGPVGAARNDDDKKAGIAPGLRFRRIGPQFDARFGGEAGHDLISVS